MNFESVFEDENENEDERGAISPILSCQEYLAAHKIPPRFHIVPALPRMPVTGKIPPGLPLWPDMIQPPEIETKLLAFLGG